MSDSETLIWSILLHLVSLLILLISPLYLQQELRKFTTNKDNQFKKNFTAWIWFMHTWSDKSFKVTVVHRTCYYINRQSLKITV